MESTRNAPLLSIITCIILTAPTSGFAPPPRHLPRPIATTPLYSQESATETTNSVITTDESATLTQSLQAENSLLKSRLKLLQSQNDELLQRQRVLDQQQQINPMGERNVVEQRLILEDFEGEGSSYVDAMGRPVDGWDKQNKRYTEPRDETIESITTDSEEEEEDELGLDSDAMTAPEYEEEEEEEQPKLNQIQSTQLNESDDDLCEYNEETNQWTRSSTLDECPVEPNISFLDALKSRANWLVGLLALQSCSGFILARNEVLLQDHPVIVYFLTMLVGAGGNAGNQASVRVIRGLALGTLNKQTQSQFLNREFRMACALSTILSIAGFLRAIAFHTPFPETLAVTCALSLIVFSSICLGAVLPLFLQRLGVDPAHSSTTIQVIMDILGVVLTVFVSTTVLDSALGKMLMKALGL